MGRAMLGVCRDDRAHVRQRLAAFGVGEGNARAMRRQSLDTGTTDPAEASGLLRTVRDQLATADPFDVPTLDGGSTRLSIPEGTQTGASFRIRQQGVPHLGSRGRGDLHIAIRVVIPTRLNAEQKKLIEQLAKLLPVPDISDKDRSILDRMKDILS